MEISPAAGAGKEPQKPVSMRITPAYAAAAVVAVAIIAIAALLLTSGAQPSVPGVSVTGVPEAGAAPNETGAAPEAPAVTDGLVLVAVKDKPIPSEFGNISGVILTVNKVSVHFISDKISNGDRNLPEEDAEVEVENMTSESSEWITVFQGLKEFNLLDYTDNVLGLLGEANLSAGKYGEIRLFITRSTLQFATTPLPTVYRLSIPGNVLKIKKGFVLRPNETVLLTLDFDISRSISQDEDGNFVLKPVIKILKKEHPGKDKDKVKQDEESAGTVIREIE